MKKALRLQKLYDVQKSLQMAPTETKGSAADVPSGVERHAKHHKRTSHAKKRLSTRKES